MKKALIIISLVIGYAHFVDASNCEPIEITLKCPVDRGWAFIDTTIISRSIDTARCPADCKSVETCIEEHKKDVNDVAESGITALSSAIKSGYSRLVEKLLQVGANPNIRIFSLADGRCKQLLTFLEKAIESDSKESPRMVDLLIQYGADVHHSSTAANSLEFAKNRKSEVIEIKRCFEERHKGEDLGWRGICLQEEIKLLDQKIEILKKALDA